MQLARNQFDLIPAHFIKQSPGTVNLNVMIKTVIFDLGGVIVPLDFQRGYATIERYCGCPAAEIPKRLRKTDVVVRYETGQLESPQFMEEFSAVLGLKASHDEFRTLWSSIFLPHTLIPDAFVEDLKGRHRLLLLSNTNPLHFEIIREQYPILRHFDHYVLSYRVGAVKPSAKMYEAAIAQAGCLPEECFFTDDVLPYVEGARSAGIQAVQFQGYEQLRRDMQEHGVTI